MTHIYAFGSLCRGDVTRTSDVDLLAIVDGYDERFEPEMFSIYSYSRLREIWAEGNPFAWHLSLESKLLHASDETDFINALGRPNAYDKCRQDCEKFADLICQAEESLAGGNASIVFDLSAIFLGIRNFATCFSLAILQRPDFSRHSALKLGPKQLEIAPDAYATLEAARILCTRGTGECLTTERVDLTKGEIPRIRAWTKRLLEEIDEREAGI